MNKALHKYQETDNRYKIDFLNPNLKNIIRKYIFGPILIITGRVCYVLRFLIFHKLLLFEKPIFIIGCSRSGTTIFADMFSRHDDLASVSEAAQVFELNYYDKNIDHTKTEEQVTPFNEFCIKFFLGFITYLVKKKRRLVNKHPQNSLRIRFLKVIFQDAIFIHLIREGLAVVYSNYTQTLRDRFRQTIPFGGFPKPPLWRKYIILPLHIQYAHQWVDIVNFIQKEASLYLSSDSYIEIKYEDFCKNTYKILKEVDIFCGLNPNLRQYSKIPPSLNLDNEKWKSGFEKKQIKEIEKIIEETERKIGYSINLT